MTKAVYPGTFDPVTRGHLDIAERASEIFGGLVLAVAERSTKRLTFSAAERIELARRSIEESGLGRSVTVESFDGLLVDYMKTSGASVFVRGLRANSDFEYEFQMQLINRKMAPWITGIYLMPAEHNMYLSSTVVKEIAAFSGDLRGFVTPAVEAALLARLGGEG
jgi:pantetheine-phosphate adenylyltransferase